MSQKRRQRTVEWETDLVEAKIGQMCREDVEQARFEKLVRSGLIVKEQGLTLDELFKAKAQVDAIGEAWQIR